MAISANYLNKMNTYNYTSALLSGFNSSLGLGRTSSASGYSSIYGQLAGLNSASYGVNQANDVSSGIQNFITGMKNEAESLNQTMNALRGFDSKGVANKETVVSSDMGSLTVKASSSTKIDDVTVKIDQAASGQVNEGDSLTSSQKIYSAQNYKFEIEMDGKKHEISFSISAGATQKELQEKMAEAINKKNIGVKASVSSDSKKGTSALTIEAKNTGDSDKNRFSIKDISGNAVSRTGTGTMTQDAQDAKYSINGGPEITSSSNTIEIAKGVTGTIKKASDKEITVGMGKPQNVTAENVEAMVKQFNNLLNNTADNTDDRGIRRLYNQLKGISTSYSASLERIGINVNSSGVMSIDKDKLAEAIENGSAEKLFAQDRGASYGFSNRLAKLAADVSANPTSYISRETLSYAEPGTSYLSSKNNNPMLSYLQAARYSQISSRGLLFDMYL